MSNFTADDLKRTYIRVQFPDKHWGNVNLEEATDEQFNAWARERMQVQGGNEPWSQAERVEFCQFLEDRSGPLVKIVREVLE